MSSSGIVYVAFLFVLATLLVQPIASGRDNIRLKSSNKTVALFVLGDSVYDPGNNDYLNVTDDFKANFPPYGETFFDFPTGRFCDGRVIPDFAAMHAGLPLWEPYLQPGPHNFTYGANFASAGAGVTGGVTLDLQTQLSYLKEVASLLEEELGKTEAKELLRNAVYLASIGGVDYMSADLDDASDAEKLELVQYVVGNLTDVVMEIYEMGGRKFAFQNVAPLGCSPEAKQANNMSSDECVESLSAIARLHNDALNNATIELKTKLPEFHYSIFDYYASLYDRIENPSKYGFKEANVACCGSGTYRGSDCGIGDYELCSDPNEYLFFDGDHPCERAYNQLTALLWNGGTNVTSPINMKQLHDLDLHDVETS